MDASIELTAADAAYPSQPMVRQFRQILLWPLQLMPLKEGAQIQNSLGTAGAVAEPEQSGLA